MCIWISKNKTIKCDRKSTDGSEYCLFHKPDKTKDEAALFWRLINFKNSSRKLIEINSRIHLGGKFNSQISQMAGQELDEIHNSNFSPEERAKPDFFSLKESIVGLYYESKIAGRGITIQPNFVGFIFPKCDAFNYQFRYDYNPHGDGSLVFRECIFDGFMNFSGFTFIGQTIFQDCDFRGGVIFTNAEFLGSVSFVNTPINTGFGILGMGIFQDTRFQGRKVRFENVTGLLKFDSIFSDRTDFELVNMHFPTDFGRASFGEEAYRLARIQKEKNGDFGGAAEYFYLEKCYKGYQILPDPYFLDKSKKGLEKIQIFNYLIRDKAYRKLIPKLIDITFKHSTGYGERPSYVIRALVIVIFVFAIAYMFSGIELRNQASGPLLIKYKLSGVDLFRISHWNMVLDDFFTSFYFSVLTCTSFGYIDAFPATAWTKLLSSIETISGMTLFGAWTATLLRKVIK